MLAAFTTANPLRCVFRIVLFRCEPMVFRGRIAGNFRNLYPVKFCSAFRILDGVLLTHTGVRCNEKKLQEQIERAQTLSDNPKKRFFRIYFRGCQYLFIDSGVRIADPE